jgi:large subunit ribosomal protein L4
MSETTTFEAAAYTSLGTARERVSLPAPLFDGTINMPVMHRAVKAYLTNQRQGNASTKTRGEVMGGNQKPWKQKGTGRARQGSSRAPHWPGGGTAFGPRPKSYDEVVPAKMRVLARKSALNARARENSIFIIDAFAWTAPRTKTLVALLDRMGVSDDKVLVLTDGSKSNVYLSSRNLRNVQVLPYRDVSTYHILWSDAVLIEAAAIGQTLAPVAEKEAGPAKAKARKVAPAPAEPKKTAAKAAAKKATAKKTAAKLTSKVAAKAPAAKKPAAKKAAPPKKKGK